MDVLDALTDDRQRVFFLNGEKKLLSPICQPKFTEAPLADLALGHPGAENYRVTRRISRTKPASTLTPDDSGPIKTISSPFSLDIMQVDFWPYLTNGTLDLSLSMWGDLRIGTLLQKFFAGTIRRRFFFFRTVRPGYFAITAESPALFSTPDDLSSPPGGELPKPMLAPLFDGFPPDLILLNTAARGLIRVHGLANPLAALTESELSIIRPGSSLDEMISYFIYFAVDISLSGHSQLVGGQLSYDKPLRLREYTLVYSRSADPPNPGELPDVEGAALSGSETIFLKPVCPIVQESPLLPYDPAIASVAFYLDEVDPLALLGRDYKAPFLLAPFSAPGGAHKIVARALSAYGNIVAETSATFKAIGMPGEVG
jgi:hypothetical protein